MTGYSMGAPPRRPRGTCQFGTLALAVVLALPACVEDERAPPLNPYAACESTVIQAITVEQAASSVESARGSVALVMFYSSGCSLSVRFFPEFVDLSSFLAAQGGQSFAFSTDECAKDLEEFLSAYELTFQPAVLLPWESGELSAAFADIGIQFGSPWTKPVVAVVGKDGVVAAQWEGASSYDVDDIDAVIEQELAE